MKNADVSYEIGAEITEPDRKKPRLEAKTGRVIQSAKGVGASFGSAEGSAFVLADPSDLHAIARVPEASVVICPTATPNLTAVLPTIRAIVAEVGGMLSVATAAARTHAVPVVVGVPGLMATVKNGDTVRLDARRGVVKVMKPQP